MIDETRWMRAKDIIAELQKVHPETRVGISAIAVGLTLHRHDDPEITWDGYLGDFVFHSDGSGGIDLYPTVSDEEWPEVRDSPIIYEGGVG